MFGNWNLVMASYPWPLSPTDQAHGINGTLGEFREPNAVGYYHFHSGIDIEASDNDPVYSVAGGKVKLRATSITVGKFRYVHTDGFQYKDDDIIPEAGVYIADVVGSHLHFMEEYTEGSGVWVNPLRPDGLNPPAEGKTAYDVATWPVVYNLWFKQDTDDGTTGNFFASPEVLYGKVDIVSKAKDSMPSPGSSNVSIYKMDYKIMDSNENIVFGPFTSFQFDQKPIDEWIFYYYQHTSDYYSTNSEYFYIPTNLEPSGYPY
jgi:hypothetical protein